MYLKSCGKFIRKQDHQLLHYDNRSAGDKRVVLCGKLAVADLSDKTTLVRSCARST